MSAQTRAFWYVATPYSKFEAGIDVAFEQACRATAHLIAHGIAAYSPIVHMHPVAVHGGLDPLDHAMWMAADAPMIAAAAGLIVVQMPGWLESLGVAMEIEAFHAAGKPIALMQWPLGAAAWLPADMPRHVPKGAAA